MHTGRMRYDQPTSVGTLICMSRGSCDDDDAAGIRGDWRGQTISSTSILMYLQKKKKKKHNPAPLTVHIESREGSSVEKCHNIITTK